MNQEETEDSQEAAQENHDGKLGLLGIPGLLKQKVLSSWAQLPFSQEMERKIDSYFQRALAILDIPSREEVSDLQRRLDQLLNRCEAMVAEKSVEMAHRESIVKSPETSPKSTY